MPRIIVTSRYLNRSSAQKSNYVRYIATREGVAPTVSERENYIGYLANRPVLLSLIRMVCFRRQMNLLCLTEL